MNKNYSSPKVKEEISLLQARKRLPSYDRKKKNIVKKVPL